MLYSKLTKQALKLCFEAHKNQLDKSGLPYVFHPFHVAEQMEEVHRDENQKEIDRALEEKKKTEIHLDAIRGCLYGGAVGDALGYPVEFLKENTILFSGWFREICEKKMQALITEMNAKEITTRSFQFGGL